VSLGVQLINNRDIVVSQPEFGFSVTYRKDGDAPMLYAIDGIDRSDNPLKVKFWADVEGSSQESHRNGLATSLALRGCVSQ
jgi:hypothetical protein